MVCGTETTLVDFIVVIGIAGAVAGVSQDEVFTTEVGESEVRLVEVIGTNVAMEEAPVAEITAPKSSWAEVILGEVTTGRSVSNLPEVCWDDVMGSLGVKG